MRRMSRRNVEHAPMPLWTHILPLHLDLHSPPSHVVPTSDKRFTRLILCTVVIRNFDWTLKLTSHRVIQEELGEQYFSYRKKSFRIFINIAVLTFRKVPSGRLDSGMTCDSVIRHVSTYVKQARTYSAGNQHTFSPFLLTLYPAGEAISDDRGLKARFGLNVCSLVGVLIWW